jgi:probable HAF family extracellular repeat protein
MKTGMRDLGTLGGNSSAAYGMNAAGEVVGFSDTLVSGTTHPFLWTSTGGMRDLGDLGGTFSEAYAVNAGGAVVGLAYIANNTAYHPFMWTATGGMQDLGRPGAAVNGVAFGINDSGEIVGFNGFTAFLWTEAAGLQNLNSLIPANTGWTLETATAINASGQIAGWGQFKGATRAFLLTPVELSK